MRIALVKAYASRAYIIHLSVREGEGKAKFHPAAPLDGAKLFKLMEENGAVTVPPNNPLLLVYKAKKAGVDEIVREFGAFVQKIFDCIHTGDSI